MKNPDGLAKIYSGYVGGERQAKLRGLFWKSRESKGSARQEFMDSGRGALSSVIA